MSRTTLHRRLFDEDSDMDTRNEWDERTHILQKEIEPDGSDIGHNQHDIPDQLTHCSTQAQSPPNYIPSYSSDSSSEELETTSDDDSENENVPDNESVEGISSDTDIDDVASDENEDQLSTSDIVSTGDVEEDSSCLYEGSDISINAAILKVLKLYIAERWSKNSLDANIKLIKSLLPKPNFFPSSRKNLLTKLNQLSAFQVEIEHFYCSDCQLAKETDSEICKGCKSEKTGVFFEFSTEDQLKFMFEHRGLAAAIDEYRDRATQEGFICDIQDSSQYKEVRSKLEGLYDLVLLLNSDGVSVSTSSKQELWAILSVICEVHPRKRSSFMLVSGVFVDRVKPKMNTFLKPFVNSMKNIYEKGGMTWVHPGNKELMTSQVVCPIVCADAPAKAIMLHMRYFSHRFGCNICEQKAEKIKLTPEDIAAEEESAQQTTAAGKKKKRKKTTLRRFVFQVNAAPLRTAARMKLLAQLAELRGKSRKGVIGQPELSELPLIDIGVCICAEYLHLVCLGIVKYFVNIMFKVKGPWYIGNHTKDIDEFILSIKVPDFLRRLPRGLRDLKFLKGSELRALLIFYSLPAFKPYLPEEYFQHWMLLVAAIHILLKESISEEDLQTADIMLRCFVRDVAELYHKKYYTYNVHRLLAAWY